MRRWWRVAVSAAVGLLVWWLLGSEDVQPVSLTPVVATSTPSVVPVPSRPTIQPAAPPKPKLPIIEDAATDEPQPFPMERGLYVRDFTLRVVDEAGVAVQGARIKTVLPPEASRVDDCVTNVEGRCAFRVLSPFLAQDMPFLVEAPSFASQSVKRNEAGQPIVLHRGRSIQVTVQSTGPLNTPLLMWFVGPEWRSLLPVTEPGSFEVSGAPMGEFRVSVYQSPDLLIPLAKRTVRADDASAIFSVEPRRVEAQVELGREPTEQDEGVAKLKCGSFPEQLGALRANGTSVVVVFGYAPPGPCTIEAAGQVSAPFSPPAMVVLRAR